MRKLIAGVVMNPEQNAEWYTVKLKNQDGTYSVLLSEKFDRKKSYGVDFAIETAERALVEQSIVALTTEEIEWIRTVDAVEYQEEIKTAGSQI